MSESLNRLIDRYETKHKQKISSKYPFIIRFDAKGTRLNHVDVYDNNYRASLYKSAVKIMNLIGGNGISKDNIIAFIQSDEINIICQPNKQIADFVKNHKNDVQKLISTLSGNISLIFNQHFEGNPIIFDVKIFNIPKKHIQTYLIWRQKQAENYSIQYYAKQYLSFDERFKRNHKHLKKELLKKDFDFDKLDDVHKYGFLVNGAFLYTFPEMKYHKSNEISMKILFKNIRGKKFNLT